MEKPFGRDLTSAQAMVPKPAARSSRLFRDLYSSINFSP
ncbi:MAG: hypothetical protein ACK2T3_16090 [Candidatus Promineifilaceae bacterium]